VHIYLCSDKTAKDKKGVLQAAGYPRDPKRVQVLEGLAQVLLEQGKADAAAAAAGAEERTTANVSASAAANARLMFTPERAIASEPEALNEVSASRLGCREAARVCPGTTSSEGCMAEAGKGPSVEQERQNRLRLQL